jgi:hypothetical protein
MLGLALAAWLVDPHGNSIGSCSSRAQKRVED